MDLDPEANSPEDPYATDGDVDPEYIPEPKKKTKTTTIIRDYFPAVPKTRSQHDFARAIEVDDTSTRSSCSTSTLNFEDDDADSRSNTSASSSSSCKNQERGDLFDGKFYKIISQNDKNIQALCQICIPKEHKIRGFVTSSANFLRL